MIDFLLQSTLSNLLIASGIALIAWQVQKRIASASLANLLWALVLVKLLTPPVVSLPVLRVPSLTSNTAQAGSYEAALSVPAESVALLDLDSAYAIHGTAEQPDATTKKTIAWSAMVAPAMLFVWALGSITLLLISTYRVLRFHLLLRASCEQAESQLISLADQVSRRINLTRRPSLLVTNANIAPFVWWRQGRAAVVVSKVTAQQLSQPDLENVFAHEMSHIKRRDHWMRWLEWACLIALWWNPLMWFARRQLRLSEEMACDEMVISSSCSSKQHYANSLLNMAELLAASTTRPPVVASAFNSGGHLEKRLRAMLNQSWKVPTNLRLAILGLALCLFPMGLVAAQDLGAIEKRLAGAVRAGEITLEQATVMMAALRDSNESDGESGTGQNKQHEARNNAELLKRVKELELAARNVQEVERASQLLIAELKQALALAAEGSQHADYGDSNLAKFDAVLAELKSRYPKYAKELEKSMANGELTKDAAERRLAGLQKKYSAAIKAAQEKNRAIQAEKRAYFEFELHRIKSAIEAGDLTEEQGEKKAFEIRKLMFEEKPKPAVGFQFSFPKRASKEAGQGIEIFIDEVESSDASDSQRETSNDVKKARNLPFSFYRQSSEPSLEAKSSTQPIVKESLREQEEQTNS